MKLSSEQRAPYMYNSRDFEPGKTPVYYSGTYWDEKELQAAIDTLLTGRWISAGEKVYSFEHMFSNMFFGSGYKSVMVNSGSSANLVLIATMKEVMGWKDGDEIIVSPVGFPTTISAIVQNGLKPVFIDIEMDTLNYDLNLFSAAVTDRTVATFVSPVLGNPPDIDRLQELANEHEITLLLDGCDSLGTKWDGLAIGNYFAGTTTSFYPAHHISTGEGGMVTLPSGENADLVAKSFASWGRDCYCVGSANLLPNGTCKCRFSNWLENYDGIVDHKYVFSRMGWNLKPLDLQGAIGIEQLKKWDEIRSARNISRDLISSIMTTHLGGEVTTPATLDLADVCWFGTPFICKTKGVKHKIVQHLEDNKIQTRNYFAGNILLHPGYAHLGDYKQFPNANKVLDHVFFVGAAPHYTKEVFNYINEVVCKIEL